MKRTILFLNHYIMISKSIMSNLSGIALGGSDRDETEQDPAGLLGTGTFLFHSSLHDLPGVPKARFIQLLIQEGRGCRDKGGTARKQ